MELEHTEIPQGKSDNGVLEAEPRPRQVVLVVDDDLTHLHLIELVRDVLNISIHTVESAIDALSALKTGAFDAVLMDCRMPGMDGFECTRRWRAIEAENGLKRTPIIAVTGISDIDIKERCASAGMDTCVIKPFALEELQEALKVVASNN